MYNCDNGFHGHNHKMFMFFPGHNHKMGFDDKHGQYPLPARKERFVNNIDTSTRKVSKLNLNFRICKLYIPKIILLFVGFISKLKLCVLNACSC